MSNGFAAADHELQGRPEGASEMQTTTRSLIRVVIADDHPIVRDGLKRLLALENDIEVVAEAGDGR